MTTTIKIAPRNSVVLVMDKTIGTVPLSMNGRVVSATASCIAVGTLSEMDGETTISFVDDYDKNNLSVVFDGCIEVPTRVVSVCDINNISLITKKTSTQSPRVRIFFNDPTEPDRIDIIVE